MLIGKVVGTVIATRKEEELEGLRFLLVRGLDLEGKPTSTLVVAVDAHEEEELSALKKRGEENGVEGLRLIDAAEIRKQEPHIRGTAALVAAVAVS